MNAITPTIAASASDSSDLDARLAFLAIADAHFHLVKSGAESLDIGFDRVAETFDAMFPPDPVSRDTDSDTYLNRPALRNAGKPRPTPQATVEAIMYCVRQRGVAALKEPDTAGRLAECDQVARVEINRRIARLRAKGVIQ